MPSDDLLTRAVEEAVPKELAEEKLRSGKPLRVYLGIDPTGSKLHLGHTVPLRKLQAFAEAGHHAIFLVGSFTAMIGDPTGRDATRPVLTQEEVKANFRTYEKQASSVLDFSKVEIRYNDEWFSNMNSADLLNLARHFTVQQMMHRDMFKERIKNEEDLSPNEFLYPIMQGYDSVMLDVDCEIGGNDQLFNMLCGRKLQKIYEKRDKFVLTVKLIEGTDGRKMSKSYGNCVYLEDAPGEMYGKLMSMKDELIMTYFECCTDVPLTDIAVMQKAMEKGSNPVEFKKKLAAEIVQMYHGKNAADEAADAFVKQFAKGETPEDMPEIRAKKGSALIDVLVSAKLIASKSEGRRLIEQKGITLNGEVVTSADAKAEEGIVKVGKRRFGRIVL